MNFNSLTRFLVYVLRHNLDLFVKINAWFVVLILLQILFLLLLKHNLEILKTSIELSFLWLTLMVLSLIIQPFVWRIIAFSNHNLVKRSKALIYNKLLETLYQKDYYKLIQQFSSGEHSSNVTQSAETSGQIINLVCWAIIPFMLKMLFFGGFVFYISIYFFLAWVLAMITYCYWSYTVFLKDEKYSKLKSEQYSQVEGYINDLICNYTSVLQHNTIEQEQKKSEYLVNQYLSNHLKADQYHEKKLLTCNLYLSLLILSLIGTGLWLWTLELITPNQLILIIFLIFFVNAEIEFIGVNFTQIVKNFKQCQTHVLSLMNPDLDTIKRGAIVPKTNSLELKLKNVTFYYDSIRGLNNFSLKATKGDFMFITGASGIGKSTLIPLIMGFLQPLQGEVLLNGDPVNLISPEAMSKLISVINQEPRLWNRSIAENIAYGSDKIDYEKINKSAKRAEIAEFIETLPEKYDTFVKDLGANFSAGQKQRLMLAQIFYKDTPIIIFDEATSALDKGNRQKIWHELAKIKDQKIILWITHELEVIPEVVTQRINLKA